MANATITKPSRSIRTYSETISFDASSYHMILVVMDKTFLISINSVTKRSFLFPNLLEQVSPHTENNEGLKKIEDEDMSSLTDSNLKGLSMAVGEYSTCLIDSDNSLASTSLATRLSRKLNNNRPVYVANNLNMPSDLVDMSDFMSKFYMKVFQFISANYRVD